MSKTKFVEYRGTGFWAYDVALGILLKHLIDAATDGNRTKDAPWLADCVKQWRVIAVISDYGLKFDDTWSSGQIEVISDLLTEACESLEGREFVSADDMATWDILEGRGVAARGDIHFPTAPVVELGKAIRALLNGGLQAAPDGTWWLYGTTIGRGTIV